MIDRRSSTTREGDDLALDRRLRGCRACRGPAPGGGRPAAERRHRPGSGDARQPRAAGARGSGRDPPVPHGPRCRPDARAAAAGAGAVARHRPAALAPRAAAARRRHPPARRVPHREGDLRVPPGHAGPGPSLRPRGSRPTRAGRPVLPRPLVARQQGPPGLPGLLHQHGPARLRRAQLRPVRPGGAGRLVARPPPHRGAAGRGRPAGVRRVRDPLRARVPALPAGGRSPAGRDHRGVGRRLQHLDHRGARRPDRGGRPGGGHQRVRRADPRLPAARLVPRGRALPLRPRPDPLRQQPRAAGDGGPEAGPDHRGLSGPELPARRACGRSPTTAETLYESYGAGEKIRPGGGRVGGARLPADQARGGVRVVPPLADGTR